MKNYNDSIHTTGRIFGITTIIFIFLIPISVCVAYELVPSWSGFLKGCLAVLPIYIPITIAEVLAYSPVIGSGGSYLAFTTGNLTNLKIPCASIAMSNADIKPGTPKGEVISTLAIAASSIVTMLVILIGMLLLTQIKPILEAPILAPAFKNVLPALFGALAAHFISKNWKIAITPLLLVITLFLIVNPMPTGAEGVLVIIIGPISILASYIMYRKGFLTKA